MVIGKKSALKVKKSVYEWQTDNLLVQKAMLEDIAGNVILLLVRL